MGCDEPLARGGGARHTIRAVWFGAHRVCRRAFRDAQVCWWWAGGPRRLSHTCHKWCETWWDGAGYVETVSAGGTGGHGFSLTGGQVVAGSNPVSPTLFMQVKCYVYLLPMLTARGALDSVSTTAGSPDGRAECSAGCDTHVGLSWPRIPSTAETSRDVGFLLAGLHISLLPAARVIAQKCHNWPQTTAAVNRWDLPGARRG